MPVVNELIRSEQDGTLSFGNYLSWIQSQSYQISNMAETLYKVKTS